MSRQARVVTDDADARLRRATEARGRPVVVYVAGEGRSGSTLLGRLLHRARGVVHVGEIVHLWARGLQANERCACGRTFAACPFWQAVGATAYGGWDGVGERMRRLQRRVDRQRFIPLMLAPTAPPAFRAAHQAYGRHLATLYRAIQHVAGAQVVVDTSKHASMAFVLSQVPAVDLRVVHLVRDSRGVSNSWTRSVRRPEVVDGEALMPRYRPVHAAGRWLTTNLELELLAATGTPITNVRYEALVRSPAATLQALLDSLAIELPLPDDLVRGDRLPLADDHSVAGNPLRFRRDSVALHLDEAWRRELPPDQRWVVTALTWPLLRRYGYLPQAAPACVPGAGDPVLRMLLPVLGAGPAGREGRGAGHVYGMLPSAARPRLVVPLWPRPVAASAIRSSSVGSRAVDRLARSLLATSLQLGLGQPAIRDRVHIEFGGGAVSAWLRDVTHGRAGAVGVRLGPRRPNSKPVLQVMAADGAVLGYAKVGWNPLTRRLVDTEAQVLGGIAAHTRVLRVPRVIAADAVGGVHVVLLSCVPTNGDGRAANRRRPFAAALREVAGLSGGRRSETLTDSRFAAELWTRVHDLERGVEQGRVRAVLERDLMAASSRRVAFGFSHGDFTPWNTALVGDRVSVWDWERARDAVPVGFDALQYGLQVAMHRNGLDVAGAVSASRGWAASWLDEQDVDPRTIPLLSRLHLVELVVRYLETATRDRTEAVTRWCRSALTCLEDER